MARTPPDIILLDAQASVAAGGGVGIAGEALRYGNNLVVPNQDQFPIKFKVRVQLADTTTGASCTVKIQTSADNSTYGDVYSFVMSVASGGPNAVASSKLFTTQKRYVRANVTALTGGSAPVVNAYMTLGTFGV